MTDVADLAVRARDVLTIDAALTRHVASHDGFVSGWWSAGDPEPDASVLVLVHGGGAGADAIGNWFRVMPQLARHRQVLAIDLLGFGASRLVAGGRYDQAARVAHLASWLRHVGLSGADWVGNSMGGAALLQLSLDRPTLVRRLVLMGSAGLQIPLSPELQEILVYSEPDRVAMGRIVSGLTHAGFDPPPGLVDYRYDVTDDEQRMASYVATMELVRDGDMLVDADRLAEITVPVQIVSGRDDRVVPFEAAVSFHHLLRHARLYSIPGCGHWPMIEHPDEFVRITELFLDHASPHVEKQAGESINPGAPS